MFLDLYDLKYDHSRRLDLIGYWQYLKSCDYDPGATYWNLVQFYCPLPPGPETKTGSESDAESTAMDSQLPHWMPKFEDFPEFCVFAGAVGQFLAETGSFKHSQKILNIAHWILDKKVCQEGILEVVGSQLHNVLSPAIIFNHRSDPASVIVNIR